MNRAAQRVLVVEDDQKIAELLMERLQTEGFEVDHDGDGEAALDRLLKQTYQLIVLDLMLPKRDGLDVMKEVRDRGTTTPILVLSARRNTEDRIEGLRRGGDDYLVKPFSMEELVLRANNLIRRGQAPEVGAILKSHGLTVDRLERRVDREGKKIELHSREFSLLELLMKNEGQILNKKVILEKVWDYHFDPQTNVVDVLVCRLRAKLDKGFEQKLIHTVRGTGYVFGPN